MKRALIVLMSVISAFLLCTGMAAATETGTWRAYGNTNPITSSPSTWHCASSQTVATNVSAQVCVVRSASGDAVQAAVVVRNNRSSLYATTASMNLFSYSGLYLGDWACSSSGVGANSWSVCFGNTFTWGTLVNSAGYANDVGLGMSPLG